MDPGKGLDLDMGQVVPIGLMADGEEDKAVLRVGDDDALLEGAPLEDGEEALHEEGPAEVLPVTAFVHDIELAVLLESGLDVIEVPDRGEDRRYPIKGDARPGIRGGGRIWGEA